MSKGIARTNTLQEVQPPAWSTACSQPVCPFADNTLRTDIQVKTCWLHAVPLHIVIPTNCGVLPVNHPNNLLLPRNPRECPSTCTIFCDSHCGAMAGVNFFKGASSTAKTAVASPKPKQFHVKKKHHRLSTSQKPTASSTTFKDYQLPVQKLRSLAPSDKRKVERDISLSHHLNRTEAPHQRIQSPSSQTHGDPGFNNLSKWGGAVKSHFLLSVFVGASTWNESW